VFKENSFAAAAIEVAPYRLIPLLWRPWLPPLISLSNVRRRRPFAKAYESRSRMFRSLQVLPKIDTERLRLRVLAPDDAPAFRAMTEVTAITKRVAFLPTPFELIDAQRLIAGNGDGRDAFGRGERMR
jgi:hypothetical protein